MLGSQQRLGFVFAWEMFWVKREKPGAPDCHLPEHSGVTSAESAPALHFGVILQLVGYVVSVQKGGVCHPEVALSSVPGLQFPLFQVRRLGSTPSHILQRVTATWTAIDEL